jgi:hypothetical protein
LINCIAKALLLDKVLIGLIKNKSNIIKDLSNSQSNKIGATDLYFISKDWLPFATHLALLRFLYPVACCELYHIAGH